MPSEANAFRILSDKGMELYGWPAAASQKDPPRERSSLKLAKEDDEVR